MPEDSTQPSSLAYRKARDELWAGRVPEKYIRLLPHVQGGKALEVGAAEGVLSLLLAREKIVDAVRALELRPYRYEEGLRLRDRWRELGYDVDRCTMLCGDIRENLGLFQMTDVLIMVRTLYYLRDEAVSVLRNANARRVSRVVLCGNRGRQQYYRQQPDTDLGRFNFLSSVEGMSHALTQAGYQITTVVDQGDPIVVGSL